jgi:hypothetical protein
MMDTALTLLGYSYETLEEKGRDLALPFPYKTAGEDVLFLLREREKGKKTSTPNPPTRKMN